jgi:hypothetical protein
VRLRVCLGEAVNAALALTDDACLLVCKITLSLEQGHLAVKKMKAKVTPGGEVEKWHI